MMKKLLLVAFLAFFMLGIVACGGSSPESVAKDMLEVYDDYTAALKKVDSKEGLISAMKSFNGALGDISKKVKVLMEKDPKAMNSMKDEDLKKKFGESIQNMMAAQMAPNVMKFMTDPDVQKLSKDMQKAMSMK